MTLIWKMKKKNPDPWVTENFNQNHQSKKSKEHQDIFVIKCAKYTDKEKKS